MNPLLADLDVELARVEAVTTFRRDPAAIFRRVGKEPDPWQAELLEAWDEPGETFILASRQVGKSWGVSALIAKESTLEPTLTIVTGPGERQAKELYRKISGFIEHGAKLGGELKEVSATRTLWRNGSRLLWVPGNPATIRGFSPDLWEPHPRVRIVIEEASIAPDDVLSALRPMLMAAAHGSITCLGTAYGQRGFFWETFSNAEEISGVKRFVLPVTMFPRLMEKRMPDGRLWVDAERERLGDFWFDQEYMCRFHAPVGALFSPETIAAMFDAPNRDAWPLPSLSSLAIGAEPTEAIAHVITSDPGVGLAHSLFGRRS